jgi:hypothetical protein
MAVSFIGGENQRSRRKPPTCRKSLTNFITEWCTPHPDRGMKIYSQFIKHKFLFHIVCFSAQINDFHLNISVGGLLSKLVTISLTHKYAILAILFWFTHPKYRLNHLAFQSVTMSVPDEGYSRNESFALN